MSNFKKNENDSVLAHASESGSTKQGQVFSYKLVVKESHLDTFGHVNNATYLTIFEEARWDLITRNGFGLDVIKKGRVGPVLLNVHIQWIQELTNRQSIDIRTQCISYVGKVGKIEQKIFNEKNELCTSALFTGALFDLDARKLIEPTPHWLSAIGMS